MSLTITSNTPAETFNFLALIQKKKITEWEVYKEILSATKMLL